MSIIEVIQLGKQFPNKKKYLNFKLWPGHNIKGCFVLNDLNLSVKEMTGMALMGRSGSGKTTLLKIMAGLVQPTRGKCYAHKRVIYFSGIFSGSDSSTTLLDGLFILGALIGFDRPEILKLLKHNKYFNYFEPYLKDKLSYSSNQILSWAIFLLTVYSQAQIILIDDGIPLTNQRVRSDAQEILRNIKNNGKTFVIVGHDVLFLEQVCDEAVLLHNGRIEQRGSIQQISDYSLA